MIIPPTIKYHPSLLHTPTGKYFPAMVGCITVWPERKPVAIHRTYLKPDGSGKADIELNKMMLGAIRGGAVRLAPPDKKLIIAEGIETALSIFLLQGINTWAALSNTFLEFIILPPPQQAPEIVIAADHDDAGIKSAKILAARLTKLGHKVSIDTPPQEGWDWNDVLLREQCR
jgi:hypothetical protein